MLSALLSRAFGAGDLATVETKLSAAREQLASSEQSFRELSLEASLAPDDAPPSPALAQAQAKVAAIRDRIVVLENASEEAARLEKRRQAEARDAAEAARRRSLAQHRSACVRASRELSDGLATATAAWVKLMEAASRVERAATPAEARQLWGIGSHVGVLVTHVRLEAARLAARSHAKRLAPWVPDKPAGSYSGQLQFGTAVADAESLEKAIARRFDAPGLYSSPASVEHVEASLRRAPGLEIAAAADEQAWNDAEYAKFYPPPDTGSAQPVQQHEADEPRDDSGETDTLSLDAPDAPQPDGENVVELPAHEREAHRVLADRDASDEAKLQALATLQHPQPAAE